MASKRKITEKELREAAKVEKELLKQKWVNNTFAFNRDCLHVEKGRDKVKLNKFHQEMCQFVDTYPSKQKLLLVPRTHLKSTLITIGKTIQWICEDPSVRILIANATYPMAVTFLNVVKRHLKQNQLLIEIFGNLAIDPDKWAENAITLKQAKIAGGGGGEKESTVLCYGMGGNLVSQHFDKIILDDVVNEDTVSTREQVEKTIQFYRMCQPLLEKNGELIVIGCLTKNAKVLMGNGSWKNINRVKVGEKVFSYQDKSLVNKKVEAVIPQGVARVYEVKTKRHSLKVTDKHPFLTIKKGKVEWIKAKNLKKNDKVVTIARVGRNSSKRNIDNRFLLKSFFYLFGYLFGDGWLIRCRNRGIVGFSVAKSIYVERNNKILDLIKEWFKVEAKETKFGYYRVDNRKIGRWLNSLGFNGYAKTKRVPRWMFTTMTSFRKAFIDGILDADGSKIGGEGYRIELANKELIEDLYWLSLTCGYRPTTIFHRRRKIKAPNSPKATIGDFYSLGLTYNTRQAFGLNQFNWRWERIIDVKEVGEEEVFDLTVKDTGNFIANGYVVHNTRWAELDLYEWIMDKDNGVIQEFKVFEKHALENELWDDNKNEFVKGTVLWPEKYNLKDLTKIRRKIGPYFWGSQYQNNPFPPGDADFKREWFKYYEPSDLKGADLNKYTLIDPAISLEKSADYTGIVTVGIDKFKNVYILDIIRDRFKVNELNNAIFQQNERWHPIQIGLEDVAFQRALRYSLKQEEEKRKRWLPIIELKPHARSKDQRIKGLQPLYANGKVLHNKELVYNAYLEDELTRFPRGKNDDLIDALAYSLDLMHPPVKKVSRNRKHKYLY